MDIALSRKLSILTYLSKYGPTRLRDLAAHYGIRPEVMRQELIDLFMVELANDGGYECPIDLDFDLEESANSNSFIDLQKDSAKNFRQINLGFDELLMVIAWIDYLLPISDDAQYQALLKLRKILLTGANESGYGDAIWSSPAISRNSEVIEKLTTALKNKNDVQLHYWKAKPATPGAECSVVTGTPLEILTLNRPLLRLSLDGKIRNYRLERISKIKILPKKHSLKKHKSARSIARKKEISFNNGIVILECHPKAQWLVESYPSARIITPEPQFAATEKKSDTIKIELKYNNIHSLLVILLRLGDDLYTLKPDNIANMVAKRAAQLLESNQNA